MLYVYDPDRGPTLSENALFHIGDEEGKKRLADLFEYAKKENLWEPEKEEVFGWEAVHLAERKQLPLMYRHADDAQPEEVNGFGGRIIAELLQEQNSLLMKGRPAEEWGPARRKLLSRLYVEVDKKDKECMYLRQAFDYLDNYGHSNIVRVVAYMPSKRDPLSLSLFFQRKGDDWDHWMSGMLVFRDYGKNDPNTGWTVHT